MYVYVCIRKYMYVYVCICMYMYVYVRKYGRMYMILYEWTNDDLLYIYISKIHLLL